MPIRNDAYYYDHQLRNYILQFMAIFTGLQVKVGKSESRDARLISVPIHYGPQDRIVASILSDNTQNKPLRLPLMSAAMISLDLASELYSGVGVQRRNTFLPTGGIVPDDIKTVYQRKPIPYKMEMELAIYVSNTDQHFQILEQILMLFDPSMQIQTSDGLFDWSKLTTVELTRVSVDQNYPSAQDRRIIQSTLTFSMPVYLASPSDVRDNFVKQIFARIGAINNTSGTSYDIIAELDQQGINYELLMNGDDIGIE